MTLIKSISGIRGTLGGMPGTNLTPIDIVQFTSAFAEWLIRKNLSEKSIVIGRDARISGLLISKLVSNCLVAYGFDVVDIGLTTTPTVGFSVKSNDHFVGGIVITASHNPIEWNALKFLNNNGEFLSKVSGREILEISEKMNFSFSKIDKLGTYIFDDSFNDTHIDSILKLPLVRNDLIKKLKFKIVVDAVNSSGGFMVPRLLEKLNVKCIKLFCEPNGIFPHDPRHNVFISLY